jgi:2-oxoisovalerate dehydrogenase E1 component alpha subunit
MHFCFYSTTMVIIRMDELNPVTRTRLLLERLGLWDSHQETQMRKSARKAVLKELSAAERRKKPPMSELFNDVYHELPESLKRQQQELKDHLAKYKDKYNLGRFCFLIHIHQYA